MSKTTLNLREQFDHVHMMALWLVNDFIVLDCVLCGVRVDPWPSGELSGWEEWTPRRVIEGRLQGEEAVNVLVGEISRLTKIFEKMGQRFEKDWINARQLQTIQWKSNLYSSGYGGLLEIFCSVGSRLERCRDWQELHDCLRAEEGDADIGDLVVAAEQEYAALLRTAAAEGTPEDNSAYRPAKECRDEDRCPTHKALRKLLAANPWIRTRKPRPNRLEVHAGDWLSFLRGQSGGTGDPLDLPAEVVDAAVAEMQARRREEIRRRQSGE